MVKLLKVEPSKPVSRVLYPDIIGTVTIYLAPMLPSGSSDQPGGLAGRPLPLYLVLLRVGFARPAGHPAAGELLPHHFTLTPIEHRGGMFLWHFP